MAAARSVDGHIGVRVFPFLALCPLCRSFYVCVLLSPVLTLTVYTARRTVGAGRLLRCLRQDHICPRASWEEFTLIPALLCLFVAMRARLVWLIAWLFSQEEPQADKT